MRILTVWRLVATWVVAGTASLWAIAQAQSPSGNVPPPPRLEQLEEGEAPAVTIRNPNQERRVIEKRAPGGKVTEIQVSTGGSTYHIRPNTPAGSTLPGDTESNPTRAAQWEILEFDLGRSLQDQQAQAAEAAMEVPSPPTPVSAPAKK